MNIKYILFLLLFGLLQQLNAQIFENCKVFEHEAGQYKSRINNKSNPATSDYDVSFYHLKLKLDPAINYIQGSVAVQLKATRVTSSLTFDLNDSLEVDSVLYKNQPHQYSRIGNKTLTLPLTDSLAANDEATVEIFYRGVPSNGLTQASRARDFIIWTLSEPYGAEDWWPCKNSLNDKADSVAIDVSVPLAYKVASNGLLLSIDSTATEATYHWKTTYAIPAYLVAIAIGDYSFHEEQIKVGEDSVLMHHFLYSNESLFQSNNAVSGFMNLFDSLFGPYPFIREKYGHASFTRGGGMEHQTMSFMSGYSGELVAHELAHQWFGNKVTCGSWQDLWLNEGFATYLNALTYENNVVHNSAFWPNVLENLHNASFNFPHSSVYKRDTTNVPELFNQMVYQKGASILHMLRWQVGDSAFFAGVKNYLDDPELAYSFAKTPDLKKHLERSSAQNLTQFFNDWCYGKGFPTYTAIWSQSGEDFKLSIDQTPSDPSVYFFNIPLPYKLYGNNWDTTIIVDPQFNGQNFNIKLSQIVDSIEADPDQWILAKHDIVTALESQQLDENTFRISPNPSSGIFKIQSSENIQIESFQLLSSSGKEVPALIRNGVIDLSNSPKGVYFLRLKSNEGLITKKLITY